MEISPSLIPPSNQVSETARTSGRWEAASRVISSKWQIKLRAFRCMILSFFVFVFPQGDWYWQTGPGFASTSPHRTSKRNQGLTGTLGGREHLLRGGEQWTSTRRGKGCLPERSARAADKSTISLGPNKAFPERSGCTSLNVKDWALETMRAARTSRATATTTSCQLPFFELQLEWCLST